MNKYLARANQLVPELVENRRHFHRHPEVRNELFVTAKYVKAQLEDMAIRCRRSVSAVWWCWPEAKSPASAS